ncbi:hypothetical protein AMATHDRAFT_72106 [Amanita thiersii Skay4041]|uniref:Copper transport protein n=1 Tax=Amanita thiersii Skay4041 TaxID=703135 RepID=A0A2A9NB35_9AGAR|nr:hypothetical protein AMATHDRAFT_72106 [Amanita thiersii Skay4041]
MDHDGGHDMSGMSCAMHMLWNTQIINTCIVFPSWHITSHTTFILSFLIIVLLGVGYEYLRLIQHRVDVHIARAIISAAGGKGRSGGGRIRLGSGRTSPVPSSGGRNTPDEEGSTSPTAARRAAAAAAAQGGYATVPVFYRVLRAALYGATVFLSFFLMLVFMTYNAYLILAVVLGAAIGHFKFGDTMNVDAVLNSDAGGKGMACH